jgi:hypothetical protein
MAVIFISEQALKDNSIINENVDMKVLLPVIKLAQEKFMLPILGTGLYNEIKAQVSAVTVSVLNKTLLDDYIQPALIWWIMAEAPMPLTYKFMNKSVATRSSENASPASLNDLLKLEERFKDNAQWYSQRITNYLLANHTLYPLYLSPGNTIDTIIPKKTMYSTGMYLGSTINKNLPFSDRFQGNYDSNCLD